MNRRRIRQRLAPVALGLVSLVAVASSNATGSAVGAPEATTIEAGFLHTCAVTSTGAVRCWGANFDGRLGDGTRLLRTVPVEVRGLTGARTVAVGEHTCALTTLGAVACWGENANGELGDGTRTTRRAPVATAGLLGRATAIAVGLNHTCALLESATVQCWGANDQGQLGNGTTVGSTAPVPVTGLTNVVAIAVGGNHTCAVVDAGGIKCWGSNRRGQLGIGSEGGSSLSPVDVLDLTSGVATIAAGREHSCAVASDGAAHCWGIDSHGQLGTAAHCGTFPNWVCPRPTAVDDLSSGVSALSAGPDNTCARLLGGALKCWGEGNRGQLGNGLRYSYVPVTVRGFESGASEVSVGTTHVCAINVGQQMRCWGDNSNGQVGDGTRRNRSVPVAIRPGPDACVTPRVKGKTLASAMGAFARTACSLRPIRRVYSKRVPRGRVLSQRPAPGIRLPAGAQVELVISKGMPKRRGG